MSNIVDDILSELFSRSDFIKKKRNIVRQGRLTSAIDLTKKSMCELILGCLLLIRNAYRQGLFYPRRCSYLALEAMRLQQ